VLVSIFGDLEYGDEDSLLVWLQAHDIAHRTLNRVAAQAGKSLQPALLAGEPVDDDWFGRHGLAHAALARLYAPTSSSAGSTLMDGRWENEEQFYQWHQMHDALHSRINAALGVTA
jgi:hypothetical protein